VTKTDLRTGIAAAGLSGAPVCAHASLRSFGHVNGGVAAIVDAFLDEDCTLMVASFSGRTFGVPAPRELRFDRNGDDEYPEPHDRVFDPSSNVVDAEMGALVREVTQRADRARSSHPGCSFSAVGPLGARLVAEQRALDVYAPLEELARLDGYIVLMGVGLDRMTMLHLAEKRAGRALFRYYANDVDGGVSVVEGGGCSNGFQAFEPDLCTVERQVTVGESVWRVFPATSALNLATAAIRRNPRVTHCGDPACAHCNDAVAGGPIV
jgi:aminoglycoside 3-N-acetyltransferase